jgi:HNH endonuclease
MVSVDARTVARFIAKVRFTETCWVWVASKNRDGYGFFYVGGAHNMVGAHRVAWMLFRGPIPDEMTIDHLCRVRCCVNPAHMEVVDRVTNVMRGSGCCVRNAAKTHCDRGHELAGANLYLFRGQRFCRACHRINTAAHRRRRREVAA